MWSSREYVATGGSACPCCGDDDILAQTVPCAEGTRTTQEVVCANCDFRWTEIYELAGFSYHDEDLRAAQVRLAAPAPAHFSVDRGVAHLPDGGTVDLLAIQRGLVDLFQTLGVNGTAEMESQLAKLTGLTFGPQEEIIPYREER